MSAAAGGVSIVSLEGNGSVVLGGNSLSLTAAAGFFGGNISGTGALIVSGGSETLTGSNTYTGGTLIVSGTTLQIGAGGTTGSIAGDVVDNGTLVFDRSDTDTFGGAISGTGGLTVFGSGTVILTGSYSYTGQTTIAGARIAAPVKGAPRGGNTLVLAGGTNTLTGDILDNGALVGDATALTLSGNISGSGSLSVKSGETTLAGNNTYAGGTTVAGATLSISADNNLGTGGLALQNDSTLQLNGSFTLSHAITVSGDPTFDVAAGNLVEINTPITDGAMPGDLVKTDSGTLLLTATNTYSGGTFVNGGTLELGDLANSGSVVGAITVAASSEFDVVNSDFSQVTTVTSNNGIVRFEEATSAASAQISVTGGGAVAFSTTATAGQAQISLDNGVAAFLESASAGDANISVTNSGLVLFQDMATAANSNISVSGGSSVLFQGMATAGNAQISASENGPAIAFIQMSTAGTATLLLSQQALLEFQNQASADHAHLVLTSGTATEFVGMSTAANAQIDASAGGGIAFFDSANADQAQIMLGNGANLGFSNLSSGGLATVTTAAGTHVNFAGLTNGGTTIGSINGAGDVILGANALTIGGDNSNSEIGGLFVGTGNLSKVGTGTLTLDGTFAYSGTATITQGTLVLGGGNSMFGGNTFAGNVVDNTTLILAPTGTLTLSGNVSGMGSVTQGGSGTTILSGINTYTGPTAVSAGTLDVNGSIANSATTVNSGATLKGNGTVGSLTLATGSTIAPGNSIGTLHVAGNVNFASGSIFQVEANPGGMADLINATGTATIDHGATVQVTAAPGTYRFGTTYTIVSAAGGVNGTFGGLTLNSPILMGQLVYGADFVDLVLSPADIDLKPFEHTPNEIATGVAVKAGGPLSTIFGDFLALQPDLAFITGTLDQLSGEIHPSLQTDELGNTQVVRQSILDRLRQSTTGDGSGLLAPSAAQSRMIVDGLTMWTRVFAETGSVDSDGNAAEIRQNQSGFLASIDAALGQGVTLGIGGGYTHAHLNQRTSSASGGDDYVIASGGWSDGPFALRAGGSYAWGSRNVTRHVSFPSFAETLTSKEDEHASQIFGEAAYSGRMAELALEPFAGLTWTDASTAAFSETGGAAALSGRGGDASTATTSLGLRLASDAFGGESLALTPRASFAWQHAFGGLRPQQIVTFEDTHQSFLVFGTSIDADMANVDVGLDAKIGDNAKLAIGYEGLLSSRERLNTLHAGLSWNF